MRKTTQRIESTPEFPLIAGAKYHVWLNYLVIESELSGDYEFVVEFDASGSITPVLWDKGDVDTQPGKDTYRPPMIPIISLTVQ